MKMPPDSPDVDTGKKNLHSAYQAMELKLLHECAELGKSGFGDKRLSAAAYQKFEEGFMLLRKALRIDTPSEYGKVPLGVGVYPRDFAPRVDDEELYGADFKHIDWKDVG